jgi:polysaccharide biosynthesis/export protein
MHPLDRLVVLAAALASLTGCTLIAPGIRVAEKPATVAAPQGTADNPNAFEPVVHEITPELLVEHRRRRLAPTFNPGRYPPRRQLVEGYGYRIGRGDVLSVIVWNHPELSNPMGTTAGAEGIGRLVRDDGTIFFPFAGTVAVAGESTETARQRITEGLRPYIENPQVDVRVVTFRSQKVYVTGEVATPGTVYLDDRPLTILDAITLSGGFSAAADRRFAHLTRDGEQRVVDLLSLYTTGNQDEVLRDGDVLHVHEDAFNQVFVMGEVGTQSTVPMRQGRLSLAEAISAAEGVRLGSADTRRIVVIRGDPVYDEAGDLHGIRPILYQLDGSQASALILAEGFDLEPRDIVFIPASTFVRWNRVIDQILPTIQTLWMTDRIIRG